MSTSGDYHFFGRNVIFGLRLVIPQKIATNTQNDVALSGYFTINPYDRTFISVDGPDTLKQGVSNYENYTFKQKNEPTDYRYLGVVPLCFDEFSTGLGTIITPYRSVGR